MRGTLVAWAARYGLPGWLVPDYLFLVAASAILGCAIALALARRDGAALPGEARSLAVAYVAALAGGYLFESLRMLPEAIATRSLLPLVQVGRAAYGGLLGSTLAALVYRRRCGLPVAPFFDRVSIGAGLVFAAVRTGCFLAGCDYGRPTASRLGIRFPAGSLPAVLHAERGLVPAGAASLPVHPTQLYEALLGLAGAAVAALVVRRGRRDGAAFLAFLAAYAIGRFAIELLRGDGERGIYLGLSTAQWVSLALLATVIVLGRRLRRDRVPAA